jgi:hypothetical protein
MAPQVHQFNAIAFEENFNLRQIAAHFPEARVTLRELRYTSQPGGAIYVFPFGAMSVTIFRPISAGISRISRTPAPWPCC